MSGAVSGPSLDPGKNNSTRAESDAHGRYDCREVYRNFWFESERGDRAPYRCGSWECYCCGYRMRMNLVEEIQRVCTARPELSRLLTLTLDPAQAPADQERQHRYITERWNALRTALNREYGDLSYIWVREEQDSGLPHLHILVSRYLPQSWVSRRWDELGGGSVVDIRRIERVEKAAHYIGKYLTKNALSGLPEGTRRYGSSSDITLNVRGGGEDSEQSWELLMEDRHTRDLDGELIREVDCWDFVLQREWGAPEPPPD